MAPALPLARVAGGVEEKASTDSAKIKPFAEKQVPSWPCSMEQALLCAFFEFCYVYVAVWQSHLTCARRLKRLGKATLPAVEVIIGLDRLSDRLQGITEQV